MADEIQPTGFSALIGWFRNALGNLETRRLRCSDAGEMEVISKPETGIIQRYECLNPISGTRQTYFFIGASSVVAAFYDYGSAVAKEARIVTNALDDADADAKAVSAGSRDCLKIGQDDVFHGSASNPITRIDIYSDAAVETGASKLMMSGVSNA